MWRFPNSFLPNSKGFSEIRPFSNIRSLRPKPLTSFNATARIRAGGSSVSPWKAVPSMKFSGSEPAPKTSPSASSMTPGPHSP